MREVPSFNTEMRDKTRIFRSYPDATGTIFHDILQEIRTDMTLIVDVGNEMFQFIFGCVISKSPFP
jgi:hypothetical protein